MAFRSNSPISLVFPPFRGMTRRIILIALCTYLGLAVITLLSPDMGGTLHTLLVLRPDQALRHLIWELVTYPFVGEGIFSVALALLSFWFFSSALEDERGRRWLAEYFLVATIGGAVLASVLIDYVMARIPALVAVPGLVDGAQGGMWPAVMAIMVAYARFHPEEQLRFNFLFTIKAKYLTAIYLIFYVALMLVSKGGFSALTVLCNALAGYGFLLFAPRHGIRVGISERWFLMRNRYYRSKRKRAAKKFTVYMRKQGKEVSLDEDGRYVDPDGRSKDPNDKRWMN